MPAFRCSLGLLVLAACLHLTGTSADAQNPTNPNWYRPFTEESQPDVYFNHYVPGNGGYPAAIYPAPLPTPPIAGHTYYTYQPFMPSEFTYTHHRSYHQSYNRGRGLNRTLVHWYNPPLLTAIQGLHRHFQLAR